MEKQIIYQTVDSYNWEQAFQKSLSQCYEMGWLSTLNDHLVIKPNLCNIISYEAGATTDVRTVELLIAFFRNLSPGLKITSVESDNFERGADDVFRRLGYVELAKKNDVNLINLTEEEWFEVKISNIPYTMNLPKLFLSDFFFVSIALPKTHSYQKITAIYKNQFGCIPDKFKERYHQYLEEVLYVLNNKLVIPDLSVIDGRIGMQGYGPVSGEPIESKFFLISNNATAADFNCAKLMGFDPKRIPYLKYACKKLQLPMDTFDTQKIVLNKKFSFVPMWQYRVIRGKIYVTRVSTALNTRAKRLVHIFFRLPSYIKERKLIPLHNFSKEKWNTLLSKKAHLLRRTES